MNLIKHTDNDEMIPLKFRLSQNYPNPFKEKTTIKYCLAYKTDVELTIYNSEKKIIERLFKHDQDAGTYEIEFSAKSLYTGNYFYRIKAGEFIQTKKMILLK